MFTNRFFDPRILSTLLCVASMSFLGTTALAQITVTSPTNNSTVAMPVQLTANVSACNGDSTMTGFGYSINSSPFITWGHSNNQISGTDYRLTPSATPYTIHYKAWAGSNFCESNITVTVTGPATTTSANIDDYATADWKWVFDTGTSGSASGSTALSTAESQDGQSREFQMTYTGGGGMRGSTSFGTDVNATHFVYDAYIYLTDPASVENVELDTNQVWDTNDDVLIYGLQCAGTVNTWEYTKNSGGSTTWIDPSNKLACNPQNWTANTWHHVQLAVHRDSTGAAFYDSITFDGTTTPLSSWNGNSSFSLDWKPTGNLVLNFQLDGAGAGPASITAYVDGMTEIYW